jgi:hypothetical protein
MVQTPNQETKREMEGHKTSHCGGAEKNDRPHP